MAELDKCVAHYAAAIVRDADLLLEDATSLNDQQQNALDQIKRSITRFMSLYDESHAMVSEPHERQNLSFEFRTPLTSIAGFCDLLRLGGLGSLTPDQLHHIQRIKASQEFILDAFTIWMKSKRGEHKDA